VKFAATKNFNVRYELRWNTRTKPSASKGEEEGEGEGEEEEEEEGEGEGEGEGGKGRGRREGRVQDPQDSWQIAAPGIKVTRTQSKCMVC
jgi:hypothetical protein